MGEEESELATFEITLNAWQQHSFVDIRKGFDKI